MGTAQGRPQEGGGGVLHTYEGRPVGEERGALHSIVNNQAETVSLF